MLEQQNQKSYFPHKTHALRISTSNLSALVKPESRDL